MGSSVSLLNGQTNQLFPSLSSVLNSSAFRGIFLYAIREYCLFDGTLSATNRRESLDALKNTVLRRNSLGDSSTVVTRRNSGDHMGGPKRARRRSSMRGGAVDEDGNAAMVEIPYLEKMRWVCKDLGYEEEYADIVGSRLLDIEGADYNTTTVNGEVPTLDTVVDFLAQAFLRFTLHAGVVLVTADDIHWMVCIVRFFPHSFPYLGSLFVHCDSSPHLSNSFVRR